MDLDKSDNRLINLNATEENENLFQDSITIFKLTEKIF
jgi:hypothetical protein